MARVSEPVDDGALKALAPRGACGFESHPGHMGAETKPQVDALVNPAGAPDWGDVIPACYPEPRRARGGQAGPVGAAG